jgi:hypothetical protein
MEVSRGEAEKVQLQERIVQLQIIVKESRNEGGDEHENGDHDDKAKYDGVCEKKCKELTHKLRNVWDMIIESHRYIRNVEENFADAIGHDLLRDLLKKRQGHTSD